VVGISGTITRWYVPLYSWKNALPQLYKGEADWTLIGDIKMVRIKIPIFEVEILILPKKAL
jgi:hypothetical protein